MNGELTRSDANAAKNNDHQDQRAADQATAYRVTRRTHAST